MKKLNNKLKQIKSEKRIGLMTHVVVGYPSLDDTVRLVKLMEQEGVDIVELQIPFSDPLADGPTIMKACEAALVKGTKVKDAFAVMKQLSSQVSIPLLFMAYYNTVFRYSSSERSESRRKKDSSRQARTISSAEKFCQEAQKTGCQGLIVPDVPIEEEHAEHFIALCLKYSLANIRVVSPASTNERLRKNAQVGTGFIYATARQGITGAKESLEPSVIDFLKNVRQHFAIPVAVGFGISKREHLQALKPYADMAIVGSALIDIINKSKQGDMGKDVSEFLKRMIY